MKKFFGILVVVTLVIGITGIAYSTPIRIEDKYWGANPTHSWSDRDIIGEADYFDVEWMDIVLSGNQLTVNIRTDYYENIAGFGTQFGDLFISTDGWNPVGTESDHYKEDNAITINGGETWEYAFDVSRGQLFDIQGQESEIELSKPPYNNYNGYVYREGQEWRLKDGHQLEAIGEGGSAVRTQIGGLNYYSISFDASAFLQPNMEIGLHWTMSCGNDVIEGAFDPGIVPEPSTVFLLGLGLLGVVGIGRKRMKK